jgi:hypothetical protein
MMWKRIAYKILVGKSVGKRPLGRPSLIWEDNIINNLNEIRGCRLDPSG